MNRREAIAALLMSRAALSEVTAARRLDRGRGPHDADFASWGGMERAQTQDLTSLTISQASVLLARRQITPLQLTNAYLSRIERLNKDLNAYVTVTRDLARRDAKDAKPGRALYG